MLFAVSACMGSKKTESTAATGPLPYKSPRSPLTSTFSYDVLDTVQPDDPGYTGTGAAMRPANVAGEQESVYDALNAPSAWFHQTDCDELRIGVVDSGLDTTHPDLAANLFNVGSVGSPAYGYNFVNNSSNVSDDNSHGTHVAGAIAAVGDNGIGVVGVCWKAKVIAAKVADANGSALLSDVVDGLTWVLNHDARIVNISMGTFIASTTLSENEQFEDAFASVVKKAAQKDALIIAAAGNAGADANTHRTYPANLTSDRVLSVAANAEGFLSYESLLQISNFGGRTVHVSAPGYNMLSTMPFGFNLETDDSEPAIYVDYGLKTGTSMAAPMVAGTLALMWDHIGVNSIGGDELLELFLNYVQPHTTGTLGQPGKYLLTGAKLDMGTALEAAHGYVP